MKKETASELRFRENAVLIAASELIFSALIKSGVGLSALGEIANTASGGTPDRSVSTYFGGTIPWIKSGDLTDGLVAEFDECISQAGLDNSAAKIFEKGTLLVALYGATVGKTGILAMDAASNQAVCAVTPKSNSTVSRYLYWFLRYKRPHFLKESFGGAQPNISQGLLRNLAVPIPTVRVQYQVVEFLDALTRRQEGDKASPFPPLPSPLDEIPKVVARIEALAAKIAEARGLRQELDRESPIFWKRFAAELFGARTVGEITRLGDCVEIRGGGTPSKSNPFFWIGKIPWISPKDMKRRELHDAEDHISDEAVQSCSAKLLPAGAVVIVIRGMILLHTVPAAILRVPAAINQDMKALIPKPGLSSEYLSEVLWAQNGQLLECVEKSTHDTRKLQTEKLLDFQFRLPPPTEQKRIVSYLHSVMSSFKRLTELQSTTAAELTALLPSVLDKAFKGEL